MEAGRAAMIAPKLDRTKNRHEGNKQPAACAVPLDVQCSRGSYVQFTQGDCNYIKFLTLISIRKIETKIPAKVEQGKRRK